MITDKQESEYLARKAMSKGEFKLNPEAKIPKVKICRTSKPRVYKKTSKYGIQKIYTGDFISRRACEEVR